MSNPFENNTRYDCLLLNDEELIDVYGFIPLGSESEGEDEPDDEIEKFTNLVEPSRQEQNALKMIDCIEENKQLVLETKGTDVDKEICQGAMSVTVSTEEGSSSGGIDTASSCNNPLGEGPSASTSTDPGTTNFNKIKEAAKRNKLKFKKIDFTEPDTDWLDSMSDPPTDEMSPLNYFQLFFTEDVFNLITQQSDMYSLQKYGKILNSSKDEYKRFIGIWLHMGIVHMPSMRLYWSKECRYPAVADSMSRNRFLQLLQSFHLADNQKMPPHNDPNFDKLYKIRPLLTSITNSLNSIPPEEYQCVDEQIIPFKGQHVLKQYVRNKPHKWGYKVFTRAGDSGIMYDFRIYVGKNTCRDYGIGFSGNIVMELTENLSLHKNYKIATDNWFSSLILAQELKEKGILFIGTIRQDRMKGCNMKSETELKKCGRGSCDWRVETEHNLSLVRWIDRKAINFLSTYSAVEPMSTCRRYSSAEKKFVDISRPNIVAEYNKFMGGVDLIDMLIELYRTDVKSRKWYIRIVLWCLSISVTNGWLLYRRHCRQKNIKVSYTLLQFQSHIAYALTEGNKVISRKRGRPSAEKSTEEVTINPGTS